jgi:hypothetical protein
VPGDERLWSLYEKFERAYFKMIGRYSEEADRGSGSNPTAEQKTAHKKWERALTAADNAAKRVVSEPAQTGDGLLMKIHVAGFLFAAAKGDIHDAIQGASEPAVDGWTSCWRQFIASIAEGLRRAKGAYSV